MRFVKSSDKIIRGEIGSEFWFDDDLPQAVFERDGTYVFSGRTAIDLIIQDIVRRRRVRNVHMPAWCCDSMFAPFVAHGIHVDFYDVVHTEPMPKRAESQTCLSYSEREGGRRGQCTESTEIICHIDGTDNTDIFYVTNYFGYENTMPIETVKRCKEHGAIVLYDRTHSFLMEDDPYLALADYSFASIRKWMGVIGGAVVNGVKDYDLKPYPFLACKEEAMRKKKAFIEGDTRVDKQVFLGLYAEFGHHLAEDYQSYEMDDLSYGLYKSEDLSAMRRKRKENAKYLHEHLKGVKFIGELSDNAVPLFVPVFFDTTEQRNMVRNKLIDAQIYCPIHWPKPTQIPTDFEVNKIYDTELSLVCDQRYDIFDMERIVETIKRIKGQNTR